MWINMTQLQLQTSHQTADVKNAHIKDKAPWYIMSFPEDGKPFYQTAKVTRVLEVTVHRSLIFAVMSLLTNSCLLA